MTADTSRPATSFVPHQKHRRFTTSLLSAFHMSDSNAEWNHDTSLPPSGSAVMWVSQPHLESLIAAAQVEDSAFEGESSTATSTSAHNARAGSTFANNSASRFRTRWSLDGFSQNVRTIARRASHSMRTHILPRHRKTESSTDNLSPTILQDFASASPTSPSPKARRSSFFRGSPSQNARLGQLPLEAKPSVSQAATANQFGAPVWSPTGETPTAKTIARHPSFDASAGAAARAAAAASRPSSSQLVNGRPASAILPLRRPPIDSAFSSSISSNGANSVAEASGYRFNRHSLRSRKLVPWRNVNLNPSQVLQSRSNNILAKQPHPETLDAEQMCDSVVDLRKLDVSSTTPTTTRRVDPILVLPSELMMQVLGLLEFSSLAQCALVSKEWRQITNLTPVWKSTFLRRYRLPSLLDPPPRLVGGLGTGPVNKRGQDFQKMSRARREIENNWKTQNVKAIYFNGHTDSVYCCQFDEDKIITGSRDKTIRVWDMKTYKCLRVIGGADSRPVPDTFDRPLPTHETATVASIPSVNGTPVGRAIYYTPSDYHSASILCLQYDDELLVTGSSDFTCIVWDVKTFEPRARLRHHTAGVLDVCMDERYIISCSKDSKICIWSRQTFKLLHTLTGHHGPVNAVQLRGDFLASASGDGHARLWKLDTLSCIGVYRSEQRGLATVEFSNDGRYILTGGNDQVIYKFDVHTGRCVHIFQGHNKLVRSLFLDSYNGRVISGSYDQAIRVYDFDGETAVDGDHLAPVLSPAEPTRSNKCIEYMNWTTSWILSTKSDYRRIVATSQDGRALMMDFGYDVENADMLREE